VLDVSLLRYYKFYSCFVLYNTNSVWPVSSRSGDARVANCDTPFTFIVFYRAMLCIRGTSHGPVVVCLSLSLCPCLSQAGVLLKRQNVGLYKEHHTTPQGSIFLVPKISAKFDRGRQMQVGWVKIGDFRRITGYISKTVKDRHIVSIKAE